METFNQEISFQGPYTKCNFSSNEATKQQQIDQTVASKEVQNPECYLKDTPRCEETHSLNETQILLSSINIHK